jgi:hypothetical protein
MKIKKIIKLTIKYWLNHYKLFINEPKYFNLEQIKQGIKFFRLWLQSLEDNQNPLEDEQPWITYPAREFLEQILHQEMKVFEYGIGGSTLFFIKRVVELISVEHDVKWVELVSQKNQKYNKNIWKCHYVEPIDNLSFASKQSSNPEHYVSSSEDFWGKSFEEYVKIIDQYPDNYFDIILIDGRARPSCFKHSLKKIKKNGYIVWDNTDRDEYLKMIKTVPKNFKLNDFPGVTPYATFFTKTSIWQYKDF